MTFTIGIWLVKVLALSLTMLITGLFVGAAWMKRRMNAGYSTVSSAAKAEANKRIDEIRKKALDEIKQVKAQAKEQI